MDDDTELRRMLDEIPEPQDVTDLVDVSKLDNLGLAKYHTFLRTELLRRGELMNPTTDEGRSLHSARAACMVEMQLRDNKKETQ